VRRDLVAMSEIARMAGVSRQAVGNWRARDPDFPQPRAMVNSVPAFSRLEVEAWLRQRGVSVGEHMADEAPRRRRVLRHFLYCDADLVRDFLAQIEGGIYDEEDVKSKTDDSRNVGGGITVGPASLKAASDHGGSSETARRIQQTMASEFQRLYSLLDNEGLIQPLSAFDDAIWDQIQVGEILEAPVVVRMPGFQQMAELAADFGKLMPLLELGGVTTAMPAEDLDMVRMFGEFHSALESGPMSVIATAAGNKKVRLLCRLDRNYLRTDAKSIEGEATILAKIQRKLRRGEHVSAAEFPALNRLSAKKRREFDKIFHKPDIEGLVVGEGGVSYPGAVLTVLGIYR
jgi:predicted DNA-binding transcriptional regulator AlpA